MNAFFVASSVRILSLSFKTLSESCFILSLKSIMRVFIVYTFTKEHIKLYKSKLILTFL